MTIQLQYRQFTTADLDQMIAAGILVEDEHIELIEGQVIQMGPPGILHAACVDRLNKLFSRQVADEILISVQNPLTINQILQPEPDVMLLAPRADFYMRGRPTAADVLLLIEVADSSLDYDQTVKLPLYPHAGIPEVWLVNLSEQHIECYSDPTPQGYRLCERFLAGEIIHPDRVAGVTVNVTFVLNPLTRPAVD